jgi:arylformamidase
VGCAGGSDRLTGKAKGANDIVMASRPAVVFRNYDQKALDAEYNNRAKVPDVERYKDAQAKGSDEAQRRFECRRDVAFGPGATERLDLYLPNGAGPHPIHVFIHGGYWRSNHKEEFGFTALPFVPHGAIVAVIEYALIPSIDLAELIRQCRAAIAWTWRNASTFGGDPARITVSGHSAGGHLTAMMMATDWPDFAADLPADLVKAGCGISGIYDLEPIRLSFHNEILGFTAETVQRFSPVLLPPKSRGPLLLPVGGLEGYEFVRQSEDLAAIWRGIGIDARAWVMPGHHHFSTINEYLKPESELARAVRAQMGLG